jgi:hypothetical protein
MWNAQTGEELFTLTVPFQVGHQRRLQPPWQTPGFGFGGGFGPAVNAEVKVWEVETG